MSGPHQGQHVLAAGEPLDRAKAAMVMVHVLKQCGNDLSRENIMKQAASIQGLEVPILLDGMTINTSPTNFSPIRQMQLARFDGESWRPYGQLIVG